MSSEATTRGLGSPVSTGELELLPEELERIPGRPPRYARYEAWLLGGGAVLLFLIVWQSIAMARVVREMFLPGPSDIANAFRQLIAAGDLAEDILVSAQELVLGFALAVVVGLPLGILMGWYRRVNLALDPFVSFFNSMPRVAVIPLLIIWFGIGINSKIAIIFLGAVFSIIINTMTGVRNVDPSLVKAARSFCASDFQVFRAVVLPGAVPFILAGLRLGVSHALISVVVGELVASRAGVGKLIAEAGATFQTAKVFAGIIIIAGSGIIISAILRRIEHHFESWRPAR